MLKKIVLGLLSLKYKCVAQIEDYTRRKQILLIQYFSIRKKETEKLLKRYTLSERQIKEIDQFYKLNYGRTITKKWHNFLASFDATLDIKYIPMSIYYGEVEYFMNPNKAYVQTFENKSIIALLARSIGIKTPKVLFTCTYGQLFDENFNKVSLSSVSEKLSSMSEFFVKPTIDSCSGRGCTLYRIGKDQKDIFTGKSVDDILLDLGDNYVIQNVLKNHKSISDIYDKSLNTLRVITYQWKGDIFHVPVIMRLGRNGAHVDNACAGGIYIGVEENGSLHKNAYSVKGEKVTVHPDSHIVFANHQIVPLKDTIETAKRAHRSVPMLGIVNWDFAIDEFGDPVLIEANITGGGGCWMCQIAHGKGLFGERTSEILSWLKLMKSLPPYKRSNFYFGNNFD